MNYFYKNIIAVLALTFLAIILIGFFVLSSAMTQREIIEAENFCASKGFKSVKNLDSLQGLKQTYSVHCLTPNGFIEAKND